jgi:hypothetical protein
VNELRLRSLHRLWTSEHQDIIRGDELWAKFVRMADRDLVCRFGLPTAICKF